MNKFITCLKCKIKYSECYELCKKYKVKDKMKENFNEECCLEVLDKEISKALNKANEDLFNSLVCIDDFPLKNSKEYKIED